MTSPPAAISTTGSRVERLNPTERLMEGANRYLIGEAGAGQERSEPCIDLGAAHQQRNDGLSPRSARADPREPNAGARARRTSLTRARPPPG